MHRDSYNLKKKIIEHSLISLAVNFIFNRSYEMNPWNNKSVIRIHRKKYVKRLNVILISL